MSLNIVNFSEARKNFKSLLDLVANDKNCTVIVRRDAEDAVVMSKSHYDSLMETVYLLKSPANAQHLEDTAGELKKEVKFYNQESGKRELDLLLTVRLILKSLY